MYTTKSHHRLGQRSLFLCALLVLPFLTSCQSLSNWSTEWFNWHSDTVVQQAQAVVKDGEEKLIYYTKPYAEPPRLEIVEIIQAWPHDTPFKMDDFKIVEQNAAYFKINSTHCEQFWGAWTVVKWRAEGVLATHP